MVRDTPHRNADHHKHGTRRLDDHHGNTERAHELEAERVSDLRGILERGQNPGADP